MRNSRTLRYGLTSLTIIGATLGVVLVACSDDDTDNNATPGVDAGSGNETGTLPTDDAAVDAGPKPQPARLQLVNAAFALGAADPGRTPTLRNVATSPGRSTAFLLEGRCLLTVRAGPVQNSSQVRP